MNQDHRDAIRLYAKTRGGAADADWRMTGLDPDGIDLAFGDRTLRLDFGERVLAPGDLRRILVRWAEEARQASPAAT
jgi:putative heme iron utilization protein